MKKLVILINLLEDSFLATSLFMLGLIVTDIVISEKIAFFKKTLSFMCHQQPEKCFLILGQPIGLCTRCLGIYLGFAVFYKSINQLKRYSYLYYFSIIYLLIDLVIELGLRLSINNAGRFLFGLIFSFFILRSIHLLRNYIIYKNWRKPLEIKKGHSY